MSDAISSGPAPEQGYAEDPLAFYSNVFIKFLQLVFVRFSPGNYMWSEDPNTTEILVTDQAPIALEAVELKPHLVVQRGGAGNVGLALDMFESGPDNTTDARTYTDLVSANITITALSTEGREAQRLASTARGMIRAFKRDLLKGGKIFHIGALAVSPETPPGSLLSGGSTGGVIAVSVNVPFYFQDFWSIEPVDKLLLNGVDLRVTSQAVASKQPAMNGQPLVVQTVFSLNSRTKVSRLTTPKPRK